jgi:hypothetical protein
MYKHNHIHIWEWSRRCGTHVCAECEQHRGIARCFCGWPREEHLEDDPDGGYLDTLNTLDTEEALT